MINMGLISEIKENIYGEITIDELLLVDAENEVIVTDNNVIITGIDFE